jgi:hypothetical protein
MQMETSRVAIEANFLVAYRDLAKYGFINPASRKPYSYRHIGVLERAGEWPQPVWVTANRKAWWYNELRSRWDNLPRTRGRLAAAEQATACKRKRAGEREARRP